MISLNSISNSNGFKVMWSLSLRRTCVAVSGLFLMSAGAAYAAGVTIQYANEAGTPLMTYSDVNCAQAVQFTDNGNNSYTLQCAPGGVTPPTVEKPSNCIASVTAGTMSNGVVPVMLSAGQCTTNGNTVTYQWTRSPSGSIPNNATSDSLTQGSASVSYSYQMRACYDVTNAATCSNWQTPTGSPIVVPGSGGGGGGVDSCPSNGVINTTLPWGGTVFGNAGASGILVAKFTVPTGLTTKYVTINVSEYQSTATTRYVTVSSNPCDFTQGLLPAQYAVYYGPYFTTTGVAGYPQLIGGQTYYVNLRNLNSNGTTSCLSGACNVQVVMSIYK
ncbi:MAG: hypothetical protein FWC42_09350 [Proteobacteria bacterium]|nr:hypothetical protein [Pseudomonadota bacterium]